ncbi:xylose isomerase-like protein [Xylariaceae sp. FL0594]|nr:xylose isomerase-like protein [Xylariaceae sp. FL0594]
MSCQLAITSMSLGRCYAGHSFVHKLDMAHAYGYKGIELFHEDLADFAQQLPLPNSPSTRERELGAARIVRKLCRERGISIVCLQPFMHYEGLLDRQEQARKLEKLQFWFQLARALGTDMIQIPSSFGPAEELSDDMDVIVRDLQKVADMGLQCNPPVRFVYEALCFGTRWNKWEQSWEIVQGVDRPNFGICLDTFNIAGRVYADPASPTGRTPDCEEATKESIARLVRHIDVEKVFYVQVVDAERLSSPVVPGHEFFDPSQSARMSWSRNCRLFYGERDRGAYLPIEDISRAIFQGLGYRGWVSMELFHRRMADADPGVPRELASRGAVAWKKLVGDMGLSMTTTSPIAEEKKKTDMGILSASL